MKKQALNISDIPKKLKAIYTVGKNNIKKGITEAKNFDRTKPSSQHLQELLNKNRITKAAGLK